MANSKKVIRIVISEEPVPKGRAKTTFRNGYVRTYTPQHTLEAQNVITWRLKRYMDGDKPAFPANMPLKLNICFYRHKSKYLPKRETMPFRKPDKDNLEKLFLDAANGVLFADDAQICTTLSKKRWSPTGEGYITIKLEEDCP